MADETKPKIESEEDFFLTAGVNPQTVVANGGELTPGQVALLNETHGAAITNIFMEKQRTRIKHQESLKKQAAATRLEEIKKLFEGADISDPEKLFQDMRQWAQVSLSPEDFRELQEMTQKGGRQQKAALKELADKYKEANPMTYKPVGLIDGDSIAPKKTPDYIDKFQYLDKVIELEKQGVKRSDKRFVALMDQSTRSIKQEQ
jgi:hypothetical protein